jgi:class I fructose-bisphosphate aldolase
MRIKTSVLMKNDRSLMLACDQGLEHGPQDFNMKNIDPQYIMDIALEAKFNAVIVQSGIAEKYYHEAYRDVPLVCKINGKTSLLKGEPISPQICSVDRAIKLGADAIGYTVFDGSKHEADIFRNFGKVVEDAHDYGIPVIAWMYPRGEAVPNDIDNHTLAYSARIGLELGADMVKMKYNGDKEAFKWVVKNAGRTRVLCAGGDKLEPSQFLGRVQDIMDTGAVGMAMGRNVWQAEKPFAVSHAVREMVLKNKRFEDVKHYMDEMY